MQKPDIPDIEGIPLVGLGTWNMFGKECARTIAAAIDMGYRHLDTAQNYRNEKEVGEGVELSGARRDELFITTKVSTYNLEPSALEQSVQESLEKLQTDYIDLLLIHWPTPDMDLEATLSAMFRLMAEGKIRKTGVSNFSPVLFREAISIGPVICNQVEFSPYIKQDDNLAVARDSDLVITAHTPLGKGRACKDPKLQQIGKKNGKTAAQVTLRWLLQHGNVSVIPKSSNMEHLQENFKVFDFKLTGDEMKMISDL